jgi:hypothetical protein
MANGTEPFVARGIATGDVIIAEVIAGGWVFR